MSVRFPPFDFSRKVVEPRQRLRGGSFGWVVHRFPVKGGIDLREMMLRDLSLPAFLGANLSPPRKG